MCACLRETVYTDMDRQFLPSLGPRATASVKRRRPLPLKAAVLLPRVDGQNPSEVRLCLKKSGSFRIYRFLTQISCKEDWAKPLKNERSHGEGGSFVSCLKKICR